MMKKFFAVLFLCLPFYAGSHIGNPAVTFEGKAGSYQVTVMVNPPDVIPGTATVDVYTSEQGITSMNGKPVYWYAGDEGTPKADELNPVAGEPGHYSGMIWLMNSGASSIEIEVVGASGIGKILVPVMAVSTAQKEMPASLGYILFALCVLLVVLMVTIIGASVSDGIAIPGAELKRIRRRRITGVVIASVLLVLIVAGGKSWWDSWANDYNRFLYRPYRASSRVEMADGKKQIVFSIDTARLVNMNLTRNINFIIPDHGKLMHMFLVRSGSMDVFAHLHPKRKDSVTFVTPMPPLPEGKYLIFADITRSSGFSETIPDTLVISGGEVPATMTALNESGTDKDDTWYKTNPVGQAPSGVSGDIVVCGKPGIRTPLADGSSVIWEEARDQQYVSGKLYSLKFSITDPEGKPADLQPYLGMMGHAVVMKADGSTYIHLHPVGNFSTASQQAMMARFENESGPVKVDSLLSRTAAFRDSIDQVMARLEAMPEALRDSILMTGMQHPQADPNHPEHSIITFPYVFPSPGSYRIWIQAKRNGQILNSAFDVVVQ